MGELLGVLLLLSGAVVNEDGVWTESPARVARERGDGHELRVRAAHGDLAEMRETVRHDKATLRIRVHLDPQRSALNERLLEPRHQSRDSEGAVKKKKTQVQRGEKIKYDLDAQARVSADVLVANVHLRTDRVAHNAQLRKHAHLGGIQEANQVHEASDHRRTRLITRHA